MICSAHLCTFLLAHGLNVTRPWCRACVSISCTSMCSLFLHTYIYPLESRMSLAFYTHIYFYINPLFCFIHTFALPLMRTMGHVLSKCEWLQRTRAHTHLKWSPSARTDILRLLFLCDMHAFYWRMPVCVPTHVCPRMHAHHVRCVHTLAHAPWRMHTYTHLHAHMYLLCSKRACTPVRCRHFSQASSSRSSSSNTVQWGCFQQASFCPRARSSQRSVVQ